MSDRSFGAEYSAAYDALYGEKDYDAEVALIEEALRRYGTGAERTLLDLGCGTGSHALRLAAHGFDVTGVDLSPAMLAQARAKAAASSYSERVRFVEANVSAVDVGTVFDAAIMMFAVLGYQTDNEAVLASLRNARRHLKTGGLFVADFWYGPAVLTDRPAERSRIVTAGGAEVLRTTRTDLDTAAQTATVNFAVWRFEGDRVTARTKEQHVMRYFFPKELELYLHLAGFEVASLSAFPSLDASLSDRTWNALLVGRAVDGKAPQHRKAE